MNVQRTSAPVSEPDLLSAVLRELRFESAAYRWLELGAPYRIGFDVPGLRGVHLVARGACELVLHDGGVLPLAAGDLVVVPRGDAHVLRSPGAGSGPVMSTMELARHATGTRVRAGGPEVDAVVVCGAFVVHEPEHPALRGLPATIRLPGEGGQPPAGLAHLVYALRTEAFDGGPGSDLVLARLSDALLVRVLRRYADTADRPGWLSGLGDPYVASALAAIHADLARPWTLAALARVVGLSRAALAARFTGRVGEPAMRYLLSLRMQRAKSLLRDPRATLGAVATRVGYQSDAAFATAFKREVGRSPGAYRRAALAVAGDDRDRD